MRNKITTEEKLRALIDSIIKHDLATLKRLIQAGADVNGYEDRAKLTPLHFAVQYDFLPAIEVLISAGANPNAVTDEGETLLDIAQLHKNEAMINLLMKFCHFSGAVNSYKNLLNTNKLKEYSAKSK